MGARTSAGARLLSLITHTRSGDPGLAVGKVWASVLQLEAGDRAAPVLAAAEVMHLIQEAKVEVDALTGLNRELYRRQLAQLENLIADFNCNQPLQQFLKQLDPALVNGLEFVADSTSQSSNEVEAEEAALAEIRTALNVLLQTILDAGLDPELEALITRHVEDIRSALAMYRSRGVEPLRQAFERSVGAVVILGDVPRKADSKPFKEFVDLLAKLQTLLINTHTLGKLAKPVAKWLLGAGGDAA